MPVEKALAQATDKQLDLVEVAPQGNPVVCKLLDYGRFSYQEKKKRNEARSKQRQATTKMVKFRPNTFEGDYRIKMQKIRHFLDEGDKVKVVMQFKGREIIHSQHGFQLFDRIAAELEGQGYVDAKPSAEGRLINMTIMPVLKHKKTPSNGAATANGDGSKAD